MKLSMQPGLDRLSNWPVQEHSPAAPTRNHAQALLMYFHSSNPEPYEAMQRLSPFIGEISKQFQLEPFDAGVAASSAHWIGTVCECTLIAMHLAEWSSLITDTECIIVERNTPDGLLVSLSGGRGLVGRAMLFQRRGHRVHNYRLELISNWMKEFPNVRISTGNTHTPDLPEAVSVFPGF